MALLLLNGFRDACGKTVITNRRKDADDDENDDIRERMTMDHMLETSPLCLWTAVVMEDTSWLGLIDHMHQDIQWTETICLSNSRL